MSTKIIKSHGKTYDVRKVGESTKTIKPHVDFNGYQNHGGHITRDDYGVFDGDIQVGQVNGAGTFINGKRIS